MRIPKTSHFMKASLSAAVSFIAFASTVPDTRAQIDQGQDVAQQLQIPSQPLNRSLIAISNAFRMNVIASDDDVAGIMAPAILEASSAKDAIDQALSGSGLVANRSANGAYIVSAKKVTPQSSSRSVLDTETILVTARAPGTQSYRAESAITGTKTNTPLIEVPVSASVVTRALLDDFQVTTVTEALRYVPGISSGDNGRAAVDENITFRGFSFLSSTFVDGLRQQAFNIDITPEPYGLERVEVLRGPASVLYGTTGAGGIVNSVTRRPQREFSAEATLAAGSLNLFRGGFDVTGAPTSSDKFAARLTVHARNQDDFVDSAFNDRIYVAPAFSFFPTPNTDVTLLTSYQRDMFRLAPTVPAELTSLVNPDEQIERETFLGEPALPKSTVDTFSATLLITHKFSDAITVRNRTGVRDYNRSGVFTAARLDPDGPNVNLRTSAGSNNANVVASDTSVLADFTTGEVAHSVLVGVDFFRIRDSSGTERILVDPVDPFAPEPSGNVDFTGEVTFDSFTTLNQVGIYFQDQIAFGNLRVNLGGRLDNYEVDFLDDVSLFEIVSDVDWQFSGRAGLVYLFDNGFAPYASFSQSFFPQGGVDVNGNGFDPQESDQFEVGLKYESPDGLSSASIALFDITQKNLPNADPDNPGFSILTGEQRHRGFEAEFNIRVTPELGILGSYTYIDAEIVDGSDLGAGDVEGNRPTNVPKHNLAILAVYSMPQSSALSGLSFSGGIRFQSEREVNFNNTIQTDSFVLLDANIAYSFDKWRLTLNASNLTNKNYVEAASGFANVVRFGSPRVVIGSVTRAF